MRLGTVNAALHAQQQALPDAEPVLLIDDGKTKLAELDLLLKQRVGTDTDPDFSLCQLFQRTFAFFFFHAARQPGNVDSQRAQPVGKLPVMLFREDFSGSHHCDLKPRLDRLQRSQRRHDGLAASDVTLKQPLHRL